MCAYDTVLDDLIGDSPEAAESFETRSERRLARWEEALPRLSSGRLAMLAAACFVFLATSFYPLHHTDLWGHLAYGRSIVETGELPAADTFGGIETAQPMTHVSWLAQLSGYRWWLVAGPDGLQLAHVLLVTAAFAAIMFTIYRPTLAASWAAIGGLTAYLLALPVTGVIRPQLFGMLGIALTLLATSRLENRRHPLFWLPLVFALWCNLHGSFLIGLIVIGCYFTGAVVDAIREGGLASVRSDTMSRRSALLLLLCAAAVTLNPHGVQLLAQVLTFGQHGNLKSISEWQPTVLVSLTGGLFFGSLLLTAGLLRLSPRRFATCELLLLVVFSIATLLATRMLIWWALIWPVLMIPHAAALAQRWWADRSGSGPVETDGTANQLLAKQGTAMNTLIAVALLFVTLVISPVGDAWLAGRTRSEAVVVSRETPLFLADEVERLQLSGKIFAPLKWSDYLLWHSDGAITPLVWSHVHLISGDTWRDYRALSEGDPRWAEILDRQEIEYLVLEHRDNRPLVRQLRTRRDEGRYRVLYQDQRGLIVQVMDEAPSVAASAGTDSALTAEPPAETGPSRAKTTDVKDPERRPRPAEPTVNSVKQEATRAEVSPVQTDET